MIRTRDPRIRQTINQISHNLESANETAQESFYTFSQNYLAPCFGSIGQCLNQCLSPCFPSREDLLRRRRRGRAEANFDFYDDWDNEDLPDGGILGWRHDELDRLLAGSGASRRTTRGVVDQPRGQRKMSYGTRGNRRRSTILPAERTDPTVIPKSSVLGFLERFPFRLGSRGIKYRPSAADLQERPGRRGDEVIHDARESQPLMEEEEEESANNHSRPNGKSYQNGRSRSETQSSRESGNSLSSRGDLYPSDEEDAIPLDDEFALALDRRISGPASDDQLAGRPGIGRRVTSTSIKDTGSSRSRRSGKGTDQSNRKQGLSEEASSNVEVPSIDELIKEEENIRLEEEETILKKRHRAQKLAASQGLQIEVCL